jgi:hypothetical protein
MRIWDTASTARVDALVANSGYTAERIRRCYGPRVRRARGRRSRDGRDRRRRALALLADYPAALDARARAAARLGDTATWRDAHAHLAVLAASGPPLDGDTRRILDARDNPARRPPAVSPGYRRSEVPVQVSGPKCRVLLIPI